MIKPLTIPGQRKAAAFLYVFMFCVVFMAVRMVMPFFVNTVQPLDDVPGGIQALIGVALTALFASNTTSKFSAAVRDGKEPA